MQTAANENAPIASASVLTERQIRSAKISATAHDRDATIAEIKRALKARTGRAWSVKGNRGTAWGWIDINCLPAQRTAHYVLPKGARDIVENYVEMNTGEPNGHMPKELRDQLAEALGLAHVSVYGGVSIPAASDYRQEYIDRANGRTPAVIGQQYWD